MIKFTITAYKDGEVAQLFEVYDLEEAVETYESLIGKYTNVTLHSSPVN